MITNAWYVAMLTGTATNAPKKFPKSPTELLEGSSQPKPFNRNQWQAVIAALTGGNREKKPKKNRAKREEDNGN